MYLVVECSTTSAPSASGCCSAGDANVLSTNTFAECCLPSSAMAPTSAMESNGLVGVSTQTSRVCCVIAPRTAYTSDSATGVSPTSQCVNTLSISRNVPP